MTCLEPRALAIMSAGSLALLLSIRRIAWFTVVEGASMEPTLLHGDRLLVVSPLVRAPRHGDIVTFSSPIQPDAQLIKRVAALEGELAPGPAQMRAIGEHGSLQAEPGNLTPVPPRHLYVLGDSPGLDSSIFGPVPLDNILGTALRRREPPATTSKETEMSSTNPRYVLGFDSACTQCSTTARRVRDAADGLIETKDLLDNDMRRWRQRQDGTDGSWRPTLAIVHDDHVRTLTGWRMGLALTRHLGPARAFRIAVASQQKLPW